MKAIAFFEGVSRVTVEHEKGAPSSKLKKVEIRLEVSKNQDRSVFFDGTGAMRKAAMKPLTQSLLQGLVANVKNAHAKGWWNEVEHMKYIVDELGRAFATPTDKPFEATMEY
jgi:hypothetical protein